MKRTFARGARFTAADVPADVERIPVLLEAEDGGVARGTMYRKAGTRPKVGALMMHPRMDQSQSYVLLPLVEAGCAALGCGSRWVHNDSEAIQERILLDVAAAVRVLHAAGCEQVLLIGNSGGAALLSTYQSQARTSPADRPTTTPARDPIDLGGFDLPAADAVALIAAHPGEGNRLHRWIDPSVTDESDPLSVDPSLDMYDPANGFRVPPEPSRYHEEFLVRYRAAQLERTARIEAQAHALLEARRAAAAEASALEGLRGQETAHRDALRRAAVPDHMVIHRVLACPEWVDPSIEPDDRDLGSFNNDPRPDIQNYEWSVATFLKPEAYLSTWSVDSPTNVITALPKVADPLLIVHYGGDAATRLSEARQMLDASAASDKELRVIPEVDHWGFRITGPLQRGERSTEGTDALVSWLLERLPN